MDCLDCYAAPEELHDFYSSALNAKTTAIKLVFSTSQCHLAGKTQNGTW